MRGPVRAPVLVLIAEHDALPPKQAHDYVDALREAGGEAELYTCDEGHNSYVVDERSGSGARCWSSSAGGSRFPRLLADSKEVLPLPFSWMPRLVPGSRVPPSIIGWISSSEYPSALRSAISRG